MRVNNIEFNAELYDILTELREQLHMNGINLLEREPKESGDNYQIQCPYHGDGQERRPSAGIRKSDGVFHCFACGEVHDLHEFISFCFGRDDMGAFGWQWLLKNFLTIAVEERKDIELDYRRNHYSIDNRSSSASDNGIRDRETSQVDIFDNDNTTRFIRESELDRYRYYHPYWTERGITDEHIIELFDLGYDKETNCITFPVRDINGNCLFVARRNVKTKFFNYPKGVDKPLYGLYEYHKSINDKTYCGKFNGQIITSGKYFEYSKEIFICESMIDCILLWQAGRYAVALNGIGNNLQYRQLRQMPCRKYILATDNDKAGNDARERIMQNVKGKFFTTLRLPEDIKDIGECPQEILDNILDYEEFI